MPPLAIVLGIGVGQKTRAQYHLSLSRLNHWLPGREAHPELVQGTPAFHHQITNALLPQANPALAFCYLLSNNGLCATAHKPFNVVYTFMLYRFRSISVF
jgi:hypothetical protein